MITKNDEALKALQYIFNNIKFQGLGKIKHDAVINAGDTIRQALEAQAVDVDKAKELNIDILDNNLSKPHTRPIIDWWWLEHKLNQKRKEIKRLHEMIRTPPEKVDLGDLKKEYESSARCFADLSNELRFDGWNDCLEFLKKYAGKTIKIKGA